MRRCRSSSNGSRVGALAMCVEDEDEAVSCVLRSDSPTLGYSVGGEMERLPPNTQGIAGSSENGDI